VTTDEANQVLARLESDNFAELYRGRWDAAHAAKVVAMLLPCLELDDNLVLHRALFALARFGPKADETAIAAVTRLVFHTDRIVAEVAIHALGGMSLHSPNKVLKPLMQAASVPELQKTALFSLLCFGQAASSAAAVFVTAFESRDARIRRLAIRGLSEIGAGLEIVQQVLPRALKDQNGQVRLAAQRLASRSQERVHRE
jgi:HEAT repeat protein